jgi:integrase
MAQIIDRGSTSGKRWLVRYREPGGRTARQRERSFDRKKDAQDFATKAENDKREGSYIDPNSGKVTVRKYVAEWLAVKDMAPGTAEAYERIMRLHVLPFIGAKTLMQVTSADVEALYVRWRRNGASPNTIEARRIPLSGVFSHAVRHRRIRENPVKHAEKVTTPAKSVDERALPDLKEISLIAQEIGSRLEPAVWLMASCGLRIGEALGVHPDDLQGNSVRIRRQVVRVKNATGSYVAMYAPLKHRKQGEWRDVPVPDSLHALTGTLPIKNASGGMAHPDLLRKSWDRAIRRLGLPEYNPHDLRHKWATVTLSNGVPIHEVSRWMGHRSISVTVDLYGHLTQDGADRCRKVVQCAYGAHMVTEPPRS